MAACKISFCLSFLNWIKNEMIFYHISELMLETLILRYNKLEMCPQYMDAHAVGYLTIKLQNSTGNKCLYLSLTDHLHTYTHSYRRMYIRTHIPTYGKLKNYMPPASSDAGA